MCVVACALLRLYKYAGCSWCWLVMSASPLPLFYTRLHPRNVGSLKLLVSSVLPVTYEESVYAMLMESPEEYTKMGTHARAHARVCMGAHLTRSARTRTAPTPRLLSSTLQPTLTTSWWATFRASWCPCQTEALASDCTL
ncbi:hypothetical protein EON67_06025 [archaeon]|nr:MAG: hypothetical protein EON67_06025 [archaeon]